MENRGFMPTAVVGGPQLQGKAHHLHPGVDFLHEQQVWTPPQRICGRDFKAVDEPLTWCVLQQYYFSSDVPVGWGLSGC